MSNPIRFFENLRDMYLRYLDSPFDLRYQDLTAERRQLLDQDGRIYRHPLIEPIPAYRTAGQTFSQAAQAVLSGNWQPGEIADAAGFISHGLFPPNRALHQHQLDVFRDAIVSGFDTVVTTGTGSGKTECFLLPVIASIVRESAKWSVPTPRPAQWDWWNHFTMQGTQRRWAPRISQRAHETRPAAIRALILYPLNALVEDQLARLRTALDGQQARAWLQTNRNGNLIYFGRYTGRTPVSGDDVSRLRDELRSIHRDARAVAGNAAERFFQSMDGAEMWSRQDMQDSPPDILITNYSMLNIMLMRAIEATIFDQTRTWLKGSTDRVFHLVVDELHTYRGTPGTEVAYLLRALMDRLGLPSNSNQLRIIASSASLESGTAGLQYLEQFFSRDRNRFRVIGGANYVVPPNPAALGAFSQYVAPLAQFGQATRNGTTPVLDQEASRLLAQVGRADAAAGDTARRGTRCRAQTHPSTGRTSSCLDNEPNNRPSIAGDCSASTLPGSSVAGSDRCGRRLADGAFACARHIWIGSASDARAYHVPKPAGFVGVHKSSVRTRTTESGPMSFRQLALRADVDLSMRLASPGALVLRGLWGVAFWWLPPRNRKCERVVLDT